MLTELLLWVFAFICIGLLFWGFTRRDRIYQYPFFMGATFVAFILPQAISLVKNPELVPDTAVQRVLIMCCLCAAMCWLGYQIPVSLPQKLKPPLQFDINRLKIGAAIYLGLGLLFWMLIFSLPQGRAISGQATGIITIYFFFANILQISLVIILLETLQKPKIGNLIMLIIAVAMPVYRAIFFGRREETLFIILAFCLAFYFVRLQTIPTITAIIGIFLAALIIFNIGYYRNALAQGRANLISEINPVETLQKLVQGEDTSTAPELRNAALLIESTVANRKYGWGTSYWDVLVFSWVPAQFLGTDFKKSLQLSLANYSINRDDTYTIFGFSSPEGSTSTGIGDTFTQFDYLGSCIFGFLAFFFKFLWSRAVVYQTSFIAQIAYILLSIKAMLALTHSTANFPSQLLYYIVFLAPLILYAKVRRTNYI